MQNVYRRVVLVVEWSMQNVYRRVVLVVDWSLQNVYRRVVLAVDWSLQNVYRRVVGVVGSSIQNINEADFGDRRRICAVGRALKVSCLSSFEVLVQANVVSIPDTFTFKVYRSITIVLI